MSSCLRRTASRLLALVAVFVVASSLATAQTPTSMSGYQFQYLTTGALTDMSSGTTLINSGVDDGRSSLQNIGFTFNFGGTDYTQYSVSSNGLLGFGSTLVSTSFGITLSTSPHPWISGQAVDLYTRGNGVRALLSGSSPNRVLTVQWDIYRYGNSAQTAMFEARLHEGTNEIQFVYGTSAAGYTSWTGKVGLVASSSNYHLVNTSTNASTSTSDPTNGSFPASGTVYRFFTCSPNISIAGNTSQGAQTVNMLNGESLLAGMIVQRGNASSYQPFAITNPSAACGTRTFSYAITGPAAGDYTLSTTSGSLVAGASNMPTITFRPNGTGVRTATLTIADNGTPQFLRSYTLSAQGTPRFVVSGNPSQGGTGLMATNDTLMSGIVLYHGTCANYTPMNMTNTNSNPSATPLTYTLSLDSAGFVSTQYSIVGPTTGPLAAGATVTPTIRFCPPPTAFGPQPARLVVTTSDGDIRTYILRAVAGAPQARFSINGVEQTAGSVLFTNSTSCVGEQAVSLPLMITNSGVGELLVHGLELYVTDTTYQQGTPLLPLVRDARGRLVPATGYVLSTQPGVAPIAANAAASFPITLLEGESRTFYLTYVGPEPGRRYARAFFRTTAENFRGVDTNYYDNVSTMPTNTLGLMTLELVARSVGSRLAAETSGELLRPLVFPGARVGDTAVKSFRVANAGACDLRISRQQLRIYSGDVNEFKLLTVLPNTQTDATSGDFVIAPGGVDSIVVQFIPSRSGTRMATLRLRTNDSTVHIPGVSERGAFLLDIQGRGQAGLDPRDLVLSPVAIGSSSNGVATLENSSTTTVEISQILFSGGDAAEFAADPNAPWPQLPARVLPGAKFQPSVRMTPVGLPGIRRTQMLVISTSNDTARVNIRGEAGTQNLVVSPTSLFDEVTIPAGGTVRRTVQIANNGTLPLRILPPALSGVDSANYRLGILPRLDIEPGATEYLEVTFAPTTAGQSSAQITITPIGGAPQTVTLGGTVLRIRRSDDDVTTTALSSDGAPERARESVPGVSGVESGNIADGMTISAPAPNPAHASVELAYSVAVGSRVSIVLFDAAGRSVRQLADATVDAGAHRLAIDVSDLTAGVYHCRMTAGGRSVGTTLVVSR